MEENKLAVKPLGLLMLELSIPAIIAQLVSIIYNMVDRIFIGRIENGTSAMAALSVSLPVITLITAVTRLLGIGGAPLCAIKMGQKNQKGAEEILGTSFSKNFSIKASSNSATFSSIFSLHSLASSTKFAGISSTL